MPGMGIRHLRTVVAAVALLLVVPLPQAESATTVAVREAPARIMTLINRDRAAAGLTPLGNHPAAQRIADGWSRQMAAAGQLAHNDRFLSLRSLAQLRATMVGENVAVAGSLERIHQLFMDSPPHRRNILQPDFRLVGIAAVRTSDGRIYLTEDF